MHARKILPLVILITCVIAFSLTKATWNINYWPTDTEDYYIEAARKLPTLKFISQMHQGIDDVRVRWLHGKEGFILQGSLMQILLQDFVSLRPFILTCIISVCGSGILIFLIARSLWGAAVAGICFVFFMSSFWPYIYILFAKHQPFGLFLFLLSVFLLQLTQLNRFAWIFYFFSGFALVFAWYSSTVGITYTPYYLAALFYQPIHLSNSHPNQPQRFLN